MGIRDWYREATAADTAIRKGIAEFRADGLDGVIDSAASKVEELRKAKVEQAIERRLNEGGPVWRATKATLGGIRDTALFPFRKGLKALKISAIAGALFGGAIAASAAFGGRKSSDTPALPPAPDTTASALPDILPADAMVPPVMTAEMPAVSGIAPRSLSPAAFMREGAEKGMAGIAAAEKAVLSGAGKML